jgi:hypothetical protein
VGELGFPTTIGLRHRAKPATICLFARPFFPWVLVETGDLSDTILPVLNFGLSLRKIIVKSRDEGRVPHCLAGTLCGPRYGESPPFEPQDAGDPAS